MTDEQGFRSGRQVVFKLHVHLVLITKYRRGVITDRVRAFLKEVMTKVCQVSRQLLAFDGEDDHVHLLVAYPPKASISTLVNSLKGASAYRLRRRDFLEVRHKVWGAHFWSPSYCAVSCGAAALETVKAYIQDQRTVIGSPVCKSSGKPACPTMSWTIWGNERTLPLVPIPLVMAENEWTQIEKAITQRAGLLNAMLFDLYGKQRLVFEHHLPPALVFGTRVSSALFRDYSADGVHLHTYAADLAGSPDGRWWVIADRTQAPAGMGYALEIGWSARGPYPPSSANTGFANWRVFLISAATPFSAWQPSAAMLRAWWC